jgi:hypothetical protein
MGYFQLHFGQLVDQAIACNEVLSVPANRHQGSGISENNDF